MRHYLDYTRTAWFSYLAVLPLLLLYQILVVVANFNQPRVIVNGSDAFLGGLLAMFGLKGWMSWLIGAAIVGLILYRREGKSAAPARPSYFWWLLAESSVYALLFGAVVALLTVGLFPFVAHLAAGESVTWMQELAVRVGAGLYEELMFRLLLTGGLISLFTWFGLARPAVIFWAILISSVLFSLFHHMPGGEPFHLGAALFRFVAGVVLAGLYAARGFGVTAWTHSLYDIFLLFMAADR